MDRTEVDTRQQRETAEITKTRGGNALLLHNKVNGSPIAARLNETTATSTLVSGNNNNNPYHHNSNNNRDDNNERSSNRAGTMGARRPRAEEILPEPRDTEAMMSLPATPSSSSSSSGMSTGTAKRTMLLSGSRLEEITTRPRTAHRCAESPPRRTIPPQALARRGGMTRLTLAMVPPLALRTVTVLNCELPLRAVR